MPSPLFRRLFDSKANDINYSGQLVSGMKLCYHLDYVADRGFTTYEHFCTYFYPVIRYKHSFRPLNKAYRSLQEAISVCINTIASFNTSNKDL